MIQTKRILQETVKLEESREQNGGMHVIHTIPLVVGSLMRFTAHITHTEDCHPFHWLTLFLTMTLESLEFFYFSLNIYVCFQKYLVSN